MLWLTCYLILWYHDYLCINIILWSFTVDLFYPSKGYATEGQEHVNWGLDSIITVIITVIISVQVEDEINIF